MRLHLPIGMPLTDAKLIRVPGKAPVFLNANGVKYHVANPETMNACNFDWDKVLEATNEEVNQALTQNPINEAD